MSKKINGVLKGVAGVGTVLGGASIVTEADMMFALEQEYSEALVEELEEQTSESAAGSEAIEEGTYFSVEKREFIEFEAKEFDIIEVVGTPGHGLTDAEAEEYYKTIYTNNVSYNERYNYYYNEKKLGYSINLGILGTHEIGIYDGYYERYLQEWKYDLGLLGETL